MITHFSDLSKSTAEFPVRPSEEMILTGRKDGKHKMSYLCLTLPKMFKI